MTEMENSRCVEKWMNQDDIFNSLDYSSVRYKNRNITVLYQVSGISHFCILYL